MHDNEYVMTQKEAADFLNVSTKSISRYRKRGLPFKLVLNPVTGKQEVRFRSADLERWDEGRQLLATYARDAEEPSSPRPASGGGRASTPVQDGTGYLDDLLRSYKDQIELLREQLEDMREQLARRDRQIDDLMRLMVGLQLEYKPMPAVQDEQPLVAEYSDPRSSGLYESIQLPPSTPNAVMTEAYPPPPVDQPPQEPEVERKVFSREQLAVSIQRLRQKGKSYEEIAHGLNQVRVATLSGRPTWTVHEVQTLLPALVDAQPPGA
jgi:DNA-binding transcriptional MerR regulator